MVIETYYKFNLNFFKTTFKLGVKCKCKIGGTPQIEKYREFVADLPLSILYANEYSFKSKDMNSYLLLLLLLLLSPT